MADISPGYPLNAAQLRTLGCITLQWSKLDLYLDLFIGQITSLGWDQLFILMGENKATAPKAQILLRLAKLRDDPLARDVAAWAARVSSIGEDRNLAMHGVWGTTSPDGSVAAHARPKPRALPAERLDDLMARMTVAVEETFDLQRRVMDDHFAREAVRADRDVANRAFQARQQRAFDYLNRRIARKGRAAQAVAPAPIRTDHEPPDA